MKLIDKIRYYLLLQKYLLKYSAFYDKLDIEDIRTDFFNNSNTDILTQIYAEIGMLPDAENYYLGFSRMVGALYGWDCNMVEIGAGTFPNFSKYVDIEQRKIGKGTITAYDPYLITKPLGNIKLCHEEFTDKTDVSYADLLVGIMPCTATELIINTAIKNKKEFLVALCDCDPYEGSFGTIENGRKITSYDVWSKEIYGLAKKQERDGFKIGQAFTQSFHFDSPIIFSRKI
jgi:hypothetical protein